MKLSICLIVKDEEKNLQTCLESVKKIADEIVIVDTGSKDKTISIAKKYTKKVFLHKFKNDFSEARNYALSKCSSDWIISLDADHELKQIKGFKNQLIKEYDAFKIKIVSKIKNDKTVLERRLIIFKNNNQFKWVGACHEKIVDKNNVVPGKTKLIRETYIQHKGYLNSEIIENKRKRNLPLILKDIKQNPWRNENIFYLARNNFLKAKYLIKKNKKTTKEATDNINKANQLYKRYKSSTKDIDRAMKELFYLTSTIIKFKNRKYILNLMNIKQKSEFKMNIAGLTIKIISKSEPYMKKIRYDFKYFETKEKESIRLFIDTNIKADEKLETLYEDKTLLLQINKEKKEAYGWIKKPYFNYHYGKLIMIKMTFAAFLYDTQTIFLHASSIIKNKKGYIFCGEKRAGKSTITKLSNNSTILNDETAIIQKRNNKFFIYGNPLGGQYFKFKKILKPNNKFVKLNRIFFIKKAKKNNIKEIPRINIITELTKEEMYFKFVTRDKKQYEKTFKLIKNISKEVKCNYLYFKKDNTFWRKINELEKHS